MSTTVKDVAARAGVSPTTVHRVLTADGYASEAVRQRVLAAASELGYRPNSIARSLRQSRSRVIGHIVHTIYPNPFFACVSVGVENAAAALGLTTVTCNTHGSPQSEMEYVEVLLRQRADGIVFTAPLAEESVRRVRESGVPVCIVERPKGIRDVDVVLVDNQAGARDATEHLIAQGHRAIAYIGDECTDIVEGQRLAGYREAIERAGLEPRDDLIRLGDGELEHGRRAMGELLRLARRPTAAFGAGDLYAIGALQALWEAGFRVPDDMSVVGFDDTLAAVAIPPLTTVVLPMREMGNAAVALLHRRLTTNSEPDAEAVVLATRLVVRQSTAPCPSQQPARR